MKTTLYHLPLEPIPGTFTEFLVDWEEHAFTSGGYKLQTIAPSSDRKSKVNLQTGEASDLFSRPRWTFFQLLGLLAEIEGQPRTTQVYCSSFLTLGVEALAYLRQPVEISSYLWDQSFDQYSPYANMIPWLRPWEYSAFQVYKNVFVPCELLKELIVAAAPDAERKIHVVGLPFDSAHVGGGWDKTYNQGADYDCVYASHWNIEKNPALFLDLVKACPDLQFVVPSPHDPIRGSAVTSNILREIDSLKNLTVLAGLDKSQYYAVLNASRVQFNCSIQDWVSYPLLEGLTFDCLPLYPNFRSFPEVFGEDDKFLYRPFDVEDAAKKLRVLLESDDKPPSSILEHHDGSLTRIMEVINQ